jgi:inner membrane protein
MSPRAWLLAAVLCVIIEIIPPPTHFFFLCLAFGALAASIAAFFTEIHWIPWAVFTVTTIALVPMLIPLARFLFTPNKTASNVDELIGQKATVLEPAEESKAGSVRIRGEVWRALSESGRIEKDASAEVIRVDGTHLIVRRA